MFIQNLFERMNFKKNVIRIRRFYNKIKYNGQSLQDKFILETLNFKRDGFFIELGTNEPKQNNNTYILEKDYNWKGILVDYDNKYLESYKKQRKNSFPIIEDASKIDYSYYLKKLNFPKNIDYLQIDLEVTNKSTLKSLKRLDDTVMSEYKFAIVTFEHDIYRGNYFNTREESRKIFHKRDYKLVFPDVSDSGNKYEDWYVHSDLVKL